MVGVLFDDGGDRFDVVVGVVCFSQAPGDRSVGDDENDGLAVERVGAQFDALLRRRGVDAPQQVVDGVEDTLQGLVVEDGGGVKASEVETLRLKQLQEKSNIRTLENELAKEQKNALESIRAFETSLGYDTESAAKAAQYLETRQRQYRQGTIDITPLLDAEEFATVADLQTEQKRYQIMQYKLLLSYAQSKLMHPFGE